MHLVFVEKERKLFDEPKMTIVLLESEKSQRELRNSSLSDVDEWMWLFIGDILWQLSQLNTYAYYERASPSTTQRMTKSQ